MRKVDSFPSSLHSTRLHAFSASTDRRGFSSNALVLNGRASFDALPHLERAGVGRALRSHLSEHVPDSMQLEGDDIPQQGTDRKAEGLTGCLSLRRRLLHDYSTPVRVSTCNFEAPWTERAKEEAEYFLNVPDLSTEYNSRSRVWFLKLGILAVSVSVGVVTGLIGAAVAFLAQDVLYQAKISEMQKLLDSHGSSVVPVVVLLCFGVAYSLAAACIVVFLQPLAAGSGIPEVKTYLNGTQISGFLRFKTLVCKVVGLVLASASGLCIGTAGPMLHIGSIVGAGLSKSSLLKYFGRFGSNLVEYFHSGAATREFVLVGTACGVTAAFNAPIGAILFAFEEASSFWTRETTARSFVAVTATALVLNLARKFSGFYRPYGLVEEAYDLSIKSFRTWELLLFICVGIASGILSAAINHVNVKITKWRRVLYAGRPRSRAVEVVFVTLVSSLLMSVLPLQYPCQSVSKLGCSAETVSVDGVHYLFKNGTWFSCVTFSSVGESLPSGESTISVLGHFHALRYNCEPGYFNEFASISMQLPGPAAANLFSRTAGLFSQSALLLYFSICLILLPVTYGIAVPSGLFFPHILTGAAAGRAFGEWMYSMNGTSNPGLYAAVGACAMLSGLTRTLNCIIVITVELTLDIVDVPAFILAIIAAKLTGDVFTQSLFVWHIRLAGMPYLSKTVPEVFEILDVNDIMSRDVESVGLKPSRAEVEQLLKSASRGFPVCDSDQRIVGSVLQSQLHEVMQISEGPIIDLTQVMEIYPYTVREGTPARRLYMLFREIGLRHIFVTGDGGEVCGVITRTDICRVDDAWEDKRFLPRPQRGALYSIVVETGNMPQAGTDAAVSIRMFGSRGIFPPKDTPPFRLSYSRSHSDKFERGHKDIFMVQADESLGDIEKIEVEKEVYSVMERARAFADWYLETIMIRDHSGGKMWQFISKRWLSREEGLVVSLYPTLPRTFSEDDYAPRRRRLPTRFVVQLTGNVFESDPLAFLSDS